MKTISILPSVLLAAIAAQAQLVNDGATRALTNVTNDIVGTVIVGTNGAFTRLVLFDNALLTNSAHGVIGVNATARSNEVHLVSPSARWLMGGMLFAGSNGPFSTLVVSNGALVRANAGFIGRISSSGSNVVFVTGAGSMWSNVAGGVGLTVGSQGSGNHLIVSNGGWVVNAGGGGLIGSNSSNNVARVTGFGSVWSNGFALDLKSIGPGNSNNRLVVEDGGQVFNQDGSIDGLNGGGNNVALVIGNSAVWNNSRDLYVGSNARGVLVVSNGGTVLSVNGYVGQNSNQVLITGSGSRWSNQNDVVLVRGNTLTVTNGGWLINSNGYLGSLIAGDLSASNNTVVVTGVGSTWSNRADLFVGFAGSGNQLVVSNGATVSAGNLTVGFNNSSLNNRVVVDGGTLRVTNVSGTGVLDVRRGTHFLNVGLIEVDQLVAANSQGRFEFNGGTLAVGKSTVANGLSFDAGDGMSPATLNLIGDGSHSFASNLTIRSNAMLMGSGTFLAPVITAQTGSTISPGDAPGAIGRLSSSGLVNLRGIVRMEISKSGAVLTNDQFQAASISYLGSLVIATKIGPDALTAGDRFQLFPAGSYDVGGANVLPGLAPGLRWVNNLRVDGSIEVESLAPSVTTLPPTGVSQTAATLNGVANPKGTNTTAWFEFGFSTNYGNLTASQNLGSGNGDTNFSEGLTGLIPGVSYHFRALASNSVGVTFGADQSFPNFAQRDYIKASNTGPTATGLNDNFGRSVAMDGDILVVGAPGEASNASGINGDQSNNSLSDAGAAYVFVRSGDSWVQQAYLKASNPGPDSFGRTVAVSGDTVVVGAVFEDSNATGVNGDQNNDNAPSAGAVYVFVRNGTNWSQQAYLKASNTGSNDVFGASVAIDGDTLVVGASGEDSNATGVNGDQNNNSAVNSGAAYVFVRAGTNWSQQAYLKASNTDSNDFFGNSVSVSGDTLVVGASGEDSNATGVNGDQINNSGSDAGAAYVFVRSGSTWTQQVYLKASNTGVGDTFATSVALFGNTVVIGADDEDSNATGVDGDGSNNSAFSSGAAYVFARSGTIWTQQAYLKASNTGGADAFGASVSIFGDTVAVGAPFEDSNARGVNGDGSNDIGTNSGAAYLFVRHGNSWSQQAYLKASNAEATPPGLVNDSFGGSLALSGSMVAVGAYGEDSNAIGVNGEQNNNNAQNSGAVYVFGPPLPPLPEITVSQSGTNILNGGISQQYLVASTNTQSRSFTIKNTGNGLLTGLGITIDGPNAAKFSVIVGPVAPVAPTSNTTFTVRFAPTSPGTNTATLHIASNDDEENPFNIQLRGLSLSFTEDRDGDGLNDASEFLMASLGFNFQASQTSLVSTLFNNANGTGLFTAAQVQALNINSPLLARDPNSGLFKLTIGVEKATLLTNFFPFPMTAPQTIINAEGKLEFKFSSPDNAAFFRLEAR